MLRNYDLKFMQKNNNNARNKCKLDRTKQKKDYGNDITLKSLFC